MNPFTDAEKREARGLLGVPEHVTRIEGSPADLFRALCTCGWDGRWQWVKSLAVKDAEAHVEVSA